MKNLFVLFLCLLTLNAHAQKFLVDEDEEGVPAYSPEASNPSTASDINPGIVKAKDIKQFFQLTPMIGARKYHLSSSNNMQINFSGLEYGLMLSYHSKRSEAHSWGVNIKHSTYSFEELGTNISPNKLSGNSTTVDLTHESQIWNSSFMNGYIQFGYLFNQDKNDTTTPLQITNQTFHSFGVGLLLEKEFSDKSNFKLSARYHPSFKYKESPLSSGELEKSTLYQWSIQYRHPIATKWHLSFGHIGNLQNLNFTGAGQRSLPSAKIKHTQLSGTIGIGYAL